MTPTRRAVLLAAAGLPISLLPALVDGRLWPVWPIYAAWLLLALGLDVLWIPGKDRVRVDVDHPALLYIGDAEQAGAQLAAETPRSLAFELQLEATEQIEPPRARRGRLDGGQAQLSWPLVPRRRGPARLTRAWVRFTGPLGLMRRQWTIPLEREVPVVPNTRRVRAVALRLFSRTETLEGVKIQDQRGDGSEFDSMREFVVGDDTKRIDWKHSARHRKLLVREHRAERNHQIVLAVDTGRLMGEEVGGIPKLDHALNAALLLSYVGLKTGDRVGLYGFDAKVGPYIQPRAGVAAQTLLSRTAAGLTYSPSETNFTLGLTHLAERLNRRSLIVVMTDFIDTVMAELMIDNCLRLARRHVLLFVALRDSALDRTAAREPRDERDLHRATVAHRFQEEREIVLRRLGDRGILTLDSEPAAVSAPLLNRYLDIKRRERI